MNQNENKKENTTHIRGVVSEVQRMRYKVLYEKKVPVEGAQQEQNKQEQNKQEQNKQEKIQHEELTAILRGSLSAEEKYPVVGDYVSVRVNPYGDSVIDEIEERKSVLARPDQSGHAAGYVKTIKEQMMAANFDYVFIVTSLNMNYNLNRIARYVSITLQSGAKPVAILTKADLCDDTERYVNEVKSLSSEVEVLAVSAMTGIGMEQFESYLKPGVMIVVLGSSGVGKSTLVNALAGEDIMHVNEIRDKDGKGRHTTTHRQMLELPCGVRIIDTPGMREIGVCDVEEGINDTFSDVADLIRNCRFSNCTHNTEPGCAIRTALESGDLTEERWSMYCNLSGENAWSTHKKSRETVQQEKTARKRMRIDRSRRMGEHR